jgi:hypothetical protein
VLKWLGIVLGTGVLLGVVLLLFVVYRVSQFTGRRQNRAERAYAAIRPGMTVPAVIDGLVSRCEEVYVTCLDERGHETFTTTSQRGLRYPRDESHTLLESDPACRRLEVSLNGRNTNVEIASGRVVAVEPLGSLRSVQLSGGPTGRSQRR